MRAHRLVLARDGRKVADLCYLGYGAFLQRRAVRGSKILLILFQNAYLLRYELSKFGNTANNSFAIGAVPLNRRVLSEVGFFMFTDVVNKQVTKFFNTESITWSELNAVSCVGCYVYSSNGMVRLKLLGLLFIRNFARREIFSKSQFEQKWNWKRTSSDGQWWEHYK